jgi:hypothetical protein
MVLLSLITVGGTDLEFTYLTIVETLAGGVIGVLTNAVVVAPLHIQQPRDQIRSLTRQVCLLLNDIAAGMREGWDGDRARQWYDTSTDLLRLAPSIHTAIETGVESTRFNPRDNLRRVEVDWAGYGQTVETIRRGQWQVSGIARTLVDAADEEAGQPRPTQRFLERYAGALDEVAGALSHFGLGGEKEQATVDSYLRSAREIVAELEDEVRTTELEDQRSWPAYGAMLLDAQRLIRELELHSGTAVMPTDSGPFRRPPGRIIGR